MCKISVILPTYNGEAYIRESVESVLEQTVADFELIIVNDCSTDGTAKILEELAKKDNRIKIVTNEINLKLPASLNRGFKEAKGDYLTWTSDDNIYRNIAFEKMVTVLDNNPELGMVYANYTVVDENKNFIEEIKVIDSENLMYGNCVGACFLYRKSVYDLVGEYDTGLFLVEDFDYWLRIFEESSLTNLDEDLYIYRTHGKSLTATRQQEIKQQQVNLYIKHLDKLEKKITSGKKKYKFYDSIVGKVIPSQKRAMQKLLIGRSFGYFYYCFIRKIKYLFTHK